LNNLDINYERVNCEGGNDLRLVDSKATESQRRIAMTVMAVGDDNRESRDSKCDETRRQSNWAKKGEKRRKKKRKEKKRKDAVLF
jgi:hypothetical protein